jgi:hypothetical protein
MSEILTSKPSPNDFWTVNGSRSFGVFPPMILPGISVELPICLQRGTVEWGSTHVERKHGHWLRKHNVNVGEMLWKKAQQVGAVYTTEDDDKTKISLTFFPTALLLLRLVEGVAPYLRVVTLYEHPKEALDGKQIGRFVGTRQEGTPIIVAPAQREIRVSTKPKIKVFTKPPA